MKYTIEQAITLACERHKGQIDKCNEPYILHPIRVMMSLNSKVERVVAVLHDVLEDTDTTFEELREMFGQTIAEAVFALSRQKNESWEDFIRRVCSNELAMRVKRADISDNMSPLRLYKLEPETRIRLRKKYTWAINYMDSIEG